jgi:hypothetical protein
VARVLSTGCDSGGSACAAHGVVQAVGCRLVLHAVLIPVAVVMPGTATVVEIVAILQKGGQLEACSLTPFVALPDRVRLAMGLDGGGEL